MEELFLTAESVHAIELLVVIQFLQKIVGFTWFSFLFYL